MGGATVLSPGINLETTSALGPRFAKKFSVRRTQVLLSMERRHSSLTTAPPYLRPIQYQALSLIRLPGNTESSTSQRFILWVEVRVPAASSSGTLGMGTPSCSISTHRKRIE